MRRSDRSTFECRSGQARPGQSFTVVNINGLKIGHLTKGLNTTHSPAMSDLNEGPWLQESKEQIPGSRKVVFQNLRVHGYSRATSFQRTFSSYFLLLPNYIQEIFGQKRRTKVDILKGITGTVNPGEMLLVLGRPGSGCTTFLKAIAGRTYGLEVHDDAITYQGMRPIVGLQCSH